MVTVLHDLKQGVGADNVAFYARNGIPFVVGTTGGDREKLMQDARAGNSYAVIAPQMGKQVRQSMTLSVIKMAKGAKTACIQPCCS